MIAIPALGHVGDETLFDLAHRLLEKAQAQAVMEHLRSCPACESRFRETVRERERARIAAEAGAPAGGRKAIVGWSAAVAAVLAAVSVLALWRPAPPIAADWLPAGTAEVFLRDVTPCSDQKDVVRAVEAYRARDAAAVVALLEGKDLPAACDPVKLLLASALVHQGKDASALEVLDLLKVQSLPQPARDRALWTQAAALDHVGRHGEAKDVLHDLAARPGEFQDRAGKLLGTGTNKH